MKRFIKSLVLIALFAVTTVPASASAVPSTEGRDFWVTFLRAADDSPTELKLTISAREACDVTIENPNTNFKRTEHVGDNSCTDLVMARNNSYSSSPESPTYTALHVYSTKDISLFAGNYRDKSFDATNVIPTAALLDDYLIQTFPPSDHEDKPQGSHFAIVAVEDGETTVDFNLTARTSTGKSGAQSVTLKKGQVYYVWTGKGAGDAHDLSGTTVKARKEKKIAVFQGCPHTNIPNGVRDRDHIISQAMPTVYWGTEFGITASRQHRRDIVAVMAIEDGTEVYINTKDGDKQLVHTFDFSQQDPKHYWTFEIGEDEAYCTDDKNDLYGRLPSPLIVDSSCYLTTSCPAGVHLFMVSNRYDNATADGTNICDPAMLWISPIEQVIKEINFATYKTQQAKNHYMNILTATANVPFMTWNGNSISQYFNLLRGNEEYSYARIEIQHGSHNLKGEGGFLAHVYGYGERESYAYSCGSSTVANSITFNGLPVLLDSISPRKFCVEEPIDMKLNIGNNEYSTIEWDYGDGVVYSPSIYSTNDEKKKANHTYHSPGWYDLKVAAVYVDPCTDREFAPTMRISFQVVAPDTVFDGVDHQCILADSTLEDGTKLSAEQVRNYLKYGANDTVFERENCYDPVKVEYHHYGINTEYEYSEVGWDSLLINGKWYNLDTNPLPSDGEVTWTKEGANRYKCDSTITCKAKIISCLNLEIPNDPASQYVCWGEELALPYLYYKGDIGEVSALIKGQKVDLNIEDKVVILPTENLDPGYYSTKIMVEDINCERTLEFPIDFTVYYPADIFKYKFNNVLAVYNPGYGGNKDLQVTFTAYQWYKDGQAIPDATEPVYHTEDQIPVGEYYVLLTDAKGQTLPSCSQNITARAVSSEPAGAPAQKILRDGQICIQVGDILYDIYGQRVQ